MFSRYPQQIYQNNFKVFSQAREHFYYKSRVTTDVTNIRLANFSNQLAASQRATSEFWWVCWGGGGRSWAYCCCWFIWWLLMEALIRSSMLPLMPPDMLASYCLNVLSVTRVKLPKKLMPKIRVYYQNPPDFFFCLLIYFKYFCILFIFFFTITVTPNPYPRSESGSRI